MRTQEIFYRFVNDVHGHSMINPTEVAFKARVFCTNVAMFAGLGVPLTLNWKVSPAADIDWTIAYPPHT